MTGHMASSSDALWHKPGKKSRHFYSFVKLLQNILFSSRKTTQKQCISTKRVRGIRRFPFPDFFQKTVQKTLYLFPAFDYNVEWNMVRSSAGSSVSEADRDAGGPPVSKGERKFEIHVQKKARLLWKSGLLSCMLRRVFLHLCHSDGSGQRAEHADEHRL